MFTKARFLQLLNIIVVISVVALMQTQQAFATSVAAKKNGVKVYTTASKKGDVVKELKKGDVVETLSRKGMYWEIKIDGKKGFVSVMKVKRQKGTKTSLNNAIRTAVKQGRDADDPGNSRARSAVMGVRGLDESSETAFAGNVKPNLRLVYGMEDLFVGEQQVETLGNMVFAEIEKKADLK